MIAVSSKADRLEALWHPLQQLRRRGVIYNLVDGAPVVSLSCPPEAERDARLFLLEFGSVLREFLEQERRYDPDGVLQRALRKDG